MLIHFLIIFLLRWTSPPASNTNQDFPRPFHAQTAADDALGDLRLQIRVIHAARIAQRVAPWAFRDQVA
jgi:hypothetical protein